MLPRSNFSWAANDLLAGWGSQIAPSLKLRLSWVDDSAGCVWQSQTILWCSMCDNLSSWRYSMFILPSWSLLPARTHGKNNCFEKSRLFCALNCQHQNVLNMGSEEVRKEQKIVVNIGHSWLRSNKPLEPGWSILALRPIIICKSRQSIFSGWPSEENKGLATPTW